MLLDGLLVLAGTVSAANVLAGQLVTATGNTLGTNAIDLAPNARGGNQAADYGIGKSMTIEISIFQTLTSGGAATVQFQLVQADNAALSTNLEVINETPAFVYSTLVAGTVLPLGWSSSAPTNPRRYMGIRIVIGTAVLTNATGQFFAAVPSEFVGTGKRYYASGYATV
jgi:hypothetical protein